MSYFFFLQQSPSSSLCLVSDFISSNIEEVLLFNPSANVFIFGDFNVRHKYGLTYSDRADRPGELSQMLLLRCLTSLLQFLTVILTDQLFWIHFFLAMLVFGSYCCLSFLRLSIKLKTGCPFHCIACDYTFGYWGAILWGIGTIFVIIWEIFF